MRMTPKQSQQAEAGFTIIELMIATLVFATILVVITSGVVQFTISYYKGVNASATQNTARSIMTTVTQSLQYANGNAVTSGAGVYCVGNVHIDYVIGKKLGSDPGDSPYVAYLSTDNTGGCTPKPSLPDGSGRELAGQNMRLTEFEVLDHGDRVFPVNVGVAYGDTDLLCALDLAGSCDPAASDLTQTDFDTYGPSVTCKSTTGSQFCAISHLSTTVQGRLE